MHMKKAISYMVIGALTYCAADMYVNKRSAFEKSLKKLKKNGAEACNRVKAIF